MCPSKQRHSRLQMCDFDGFLISLALKHIEVMQKEMNDDESIEYTDTLIHAQLALDASKCPNDRSAPEGGVTSKETS